MENTPYLYLMLSRTGTGMGKVIRLFTRSRYNHVSLTLDERFQSFVSFARYVQDVPLAGGYITEPAERFLSNGDAVPVRIFRLEISKAQFERLRALFALAGNRETGLIYNSLGALLSTWHLHCPIPGSYTCLEFAEAILGQSFPSLQALEEYLNPYAIYQGDLRAKVKDSGSRSDPYFTHRGFLRGICDTAVHFARLLGRIFRITRCDDPVAAYQNDIVSKKETGLP